MSERGKIVEETAFFRSKEDMLKKALSWAKYNYAGQVGADKYHEIIGLLCHFVNDEFTEPRKMFDEEDLRLKINESQP